MNVLIVEDNAVISMHLREVLTTGGHTVVANERTAEAIDDAMIAGLDIAIVDLGLAGEADGISVVRRLAKRGVPSIILTGNSETDNVRRALLAGAFGFIVKPFREHELEANMMMAVRHAGIEKRLQERLDAGIITSEQAALEIAQLSVELEASRVAIQKWHAADAAGFDVVTTSESNKDKE